MYAPLDRLRPAAPLVIRVTVGIIFLWHGINKFRGAGISGVEGAFDMWGVPAPSVTAPLTAVIEIVGGTALIIGLLTRVAAGLLAIVIVGALLFVTIELGLISSEPKPGAELDLALLAGLIAVMLLGPGPVSVDELAGIDQTGIDAHHRLPPEPSEVRA
ncbi:MAG: DoxX family protein [Ilumatobacter sp.]